ncbi:hypothetical protein L218DRAFT_677878 [Marasmius fiardii PR-910]|nr:hypothetical protein L218DRAFT_677878 [Marasmius fiardii PR-910]
MRVTYWDWCYENLDGITIIPNILSRVCSRWRDIISNSPSLWSSINIIIDGPLHPHIQIPLATHLQNSINYPLKIRIVVTHYFDAEIGVTELSTWSILRAVIPHMWRCRVLELDLSCLSKTLERVLSSEHLSPFTFAHLTNLFIDMELIVDLKHEFWKAITQAPRLKEVLTLNVSDVHRLLYSQLTQLQVRSVRDPRSLLPVLQACQSLQTLYLDEFISPKKYSELEFACPPVVVPAVQRLDVTIRTFPDDIYPLFGMFIFPSLRELELAVKSYNALQGDPMYHPKYM